ncbi:MAG TPA: aminodeoxychorismate lyase [Burkholderiales bacterium]|nr:aminodeoxychorismate lyase [Burkholderiales bacterium]
MNLINGIAGDTISLHDRGWNYGDGVFRTLVLRDGRPCLWPRHYAKLHDDCRRLRIACPESSLLEQDLRRLTAQQPDCVVRITVTRGAAERGYAIPPDVAPTRVVAAAPLPVFPAEYRSHGIRAHFCHTRLAIQPALAGIKHLNRLENILARAEWNDPEIAEGVVCDTDGNVISGTMSNLFAVFGSDLATPDVSRCGVAGVQRQRVLELAGANGIPARVATFDYERLLEADEVFIVNSVFGIWQITALGSRTWRSGTLTPQFRQWLDADG